MTAEQLCAESSTSTLGTESQLHGPSTSSYQGKGAAFGQINPLRNLLKSRLFSYETIYPLINTAKFKAPKSQVPRQIFVFWREMNHRIIETNHLNNFKIYAFFMPILKYM